MVSQKEEPKTLDTARWGSIIAVLVYGFWMIWWAATIDARVVQTEKWIEVNRNMPATMVQVETRFEALCEKLDNLSHQLERYNAKMDRYLMPGGKGS
jgi:hypothetical protein